MLSPAFEPASCASTLLPPLSPSSIARCHTRSTTESRASAFPLSPTTPRARLSAVIAAATSPYFSPSNPFSARPLATASCARYALINTLPASPASPAIAAISATPSFRPHVHAEMGFEGCRTLRQRGRVDVGGTAHIQDALPGYRAKRPVAAGRQGMGNTVASLAAWVVLGMLISLAVLCVRARMDSGPGGAGAIRWDEPQVQHAMRAPGDIWADEPSGAPHILPRYGETDLQGIWANDGI